MADLFLDIRDRNIRSIVSDGGEARFQRSYPLPALERDARSEDEPSAGGSALLDGELAGIISKIRLEAGISIDQVHLILSAADIQSDTHRLQRMPQAEARKLLIRKTVEKTGQESLQVSLTPMGVEQNSQEWLVEYVPDLTLRAFKKECAAGGLKLKTVTTALDSTLHAIAHIRESIFNADAIYEINTNRIEAYYISASSLLLHESLPISEDENQKNIPGAERSSKKRMFAILNLLYRANQQYLAAHPMTPLQKVWLCGTDTTIPDLCAALQEAMDVETGVISTDSSDDSVVLKGFWSAYQGGLVVNLMNPDLLKRFQLRKRYGMFLYVATLLLALCIVITGEYRHSRLKKQVEAEKKALAALKLSQGSSATFTKNLDLLRRLSGGQVMFYPIFRELAMSLPDGVYLDSVTYSNKENHNTLDISATFLHASDLGTQKILTRLMEVLDRSPYLKHHQEPSITATSRELKKVMTVKISCEVNPRDTAK